MMNEPAGCNLLNGLRLRWRDKTIALCAIVHTFLSAVMDRVWSREVDSIINVFTNVFGKLANLPNRKLDGHLQMTR
jgi:hypothetical protein